MLFKNLDGIRQFKFAFKTGSFSVFLISQGKSLVYTILQCANNCGSILDQIIVKGAELLLTIQDLAGASVDSTGIDVVDNFLKWLGLRDAIRLRRNGGHDVRGD
jgi:hypothetical protein